jgi:hypothetical protein
MITAIMNTLDEKESYFHEAVVSILNQNIDVSLILNTLPDDHSVKRIERYKQDIRINLTPGEEHPGKNPDGSFYQLNRALPLIDTEWFIFASSNCVIEKDKYQKEIMAANSKGGYVGYSNFYKVDGNLKNKEPVVFGEYSYTKHKQTNFIPDQSVINYSKLKCLLPFRTKWYNMGYWDFWLRVYKKHGNVFGYCNDFTRYYRQDETQMHIRLMNAKEKAKRKMAQSKMLISHGVI